MCLLSLVVSCSVSLAAMAPARNAPSLLVRVVEAVSQHPLVNAEVIDLASGQHRFTSARGESQLEWPADGILRLRIRQIGFQFVERTFVRPPEATTVVDTVTVPLDRVAYTLPEVVTTDAGR